jgi:GT2 family glycosyltransferase
MNRTVRLQVVVYDNSPAELARLARGATAALAQARSNDAVGAIEVAFGDSSPSPSIPSDDITALSSTFSAVTDSFEYQFFDANLGSGGGSNRLMEGTECDLVWILNPDTYPAPDSLGHLIDAVDADRVAAADARQLPIEHPKWFDPTTGETRWVSGAAMLIQRRAALEVDGFDAHFFPMYCDDVDLSWRLRLAGWSVVHAHRAAVFHDKRLDEHGRPAASAFEHRSGVLSRLFLARRYGRPDVVEATLSWAEVSELDAHRLAAGEYREREAAGDVPDELPGAATVADLDSDYYGPNRFAY